MHGIVRIDIWEDIIRMSEDLGLENKQQLEKVGLINLN